LSAQFTLGASPLVQGFAVQAFTSATTMFHNEPCLQGKCGGTASGRLLTFAATGFILVVVDIPSIAGAGATRFAVHITAEFISASNSGIPSFGTPAGVVDASIDFDSCRGKNVMSAT
jgi:hypothetical protein